MSEVVISVSGVGKCYRVFENQRSRFLQALHPSLIKGVDEIWALQDINFEIKRGETVAIIGRNGGGKSTLLEILTGTLTPTTGSVKVNGRVSALLELGSGFNPEYSGRENVILNGLLLGLSKEEIVNRFPEIESFAEIGEAIDRPVKTYSSGMMMRLAFAVQVLCDPDILIIDEALSVGDIFFNQKCMRFIRDLQVKGVTILIVSHDMGLVRDLCQRGIVLNHGKFFFDGDKLSAIQNYTSISSAEIKVVDKSNNLMKPAWVCNPNDHRRTQKPEASIISVRLEGGAGEPTNIFEMGSTMIVRIHYKTMTNKEIHPHVVLKNKFDQVISAIGSKNLKLHPPKLEIGQAVTFNLNLNLAIEAGNYTLSVNLLVDDSSIPVDKTDSIGPISIVWDFGINTPPFYGMFGLNTWADFTLG